MKAKILARVAQVSKFAAGNHTIHFDDVKFDKSKTKALLILETTDPSLMDSYITGQEVFITVDTDL